MNLNACMFTRRANCKAKYLDVLEDSYNLKEVTEKGLYSSQEVLGPSQINLFALFSYTMTPDQLQYKDGGNLTPFVGLSTVI